MSVCKFESASHDHASRRVSPVPRTLAYCREPDRANRTDP